MERFDQQVIELLEIVAPSTKEKAVREYLIPQLLRLVDEMEVDAYGNLLAKVQVGEQAKPCILLSAHMDTVADLDPDRRIIRKDDVIYCTKGILGADDRAGIAIILAILRKIQHTSFEGTIKVAFTCEEEIGRCGSRAIRKAWFDHIDMAIVLDRKGSRDIVTSYAGIIPFCDEQTSHFFHQAAKRIGMKDWKIVEGGLSDTLTFAEHGIPSVNLSIGYHHPHTSGETLDLIACKDTYSLVIASLEQLSQSIHPYPIMKGGR